MANLIFDKTACGKIDDENTTLVAYSKAFLFRRVELGGKKRPIFTVFFECILKKNIHELKQVTVLWNLVNQSNTKIMCCNDISFVFNKMLDYNTAFYDLDNKHWYQDEVDSKTATCYIKHRKFYFECIQP